MLTNTVASHLFLWVLVGDHLYDFSHIKIELISILGLVFVASFHLVQHS